MGAALILIILGVGVLGLPNCSEHVQYELFDNGTCCNAVTIFEDQRVYAWKFFSRKVKQIIPWAESSVRGKLVEQEPDMRWRWSQSCPALAFAFVRLLEAMLTASMALPLKGVLQSAAETTMNASWMELFPAMRFIVAFPMSELRRWPWQQALDSSRQLLHLMKNNRSFPQFLQEHQWLGLRLGIRALELPASLNPFQMRKKVGAIPRIVLKKRQQFLVFMDCLSVLKRLKVSYFPSHGTLIGLVRYGRMQGSLSGGKVDVVDRDVDWTLLVGNLEMWFRLVQRIVRLLLRRGWHHCDLLPDSNSTASLWAGQRITLKCIRTEPFLAVADFEPLSEMGGGKWLTGFCECQNLPSLLARNSSCYCTGHTLTSKHLLPLGRCRAYNETVPCPANPVALLTERYAQMGRNNSRCWAVPSLTDSRAPNDPRNVDLLSKGFTSLDVKLLKLRAAQLARGGFKSFWKDFGSCDFTQDIRSGDFGKWEVQQKLVIHG